MRVTSRFALFFLVVVAAVPLFADHLQADCPLTLVASNLGSSNFSTSPHGAFYNAQTKQAFVLRGSYLTTYNVTDVGDLQPVRDDFIGTLGARESNGGVTFGGGYMYLSSEAGLEIYDLRGVRVGGTAPLLASRTAGLHYRRLAYNPATNTLAGLYPSTDIPCTPNGLQCFNAIDVFSLADPRNPVRVTSIASNQGFNPIRGFNDIAYNYGYLIATGVNGTVAYTFAPNFTPVLLNSTSQPGTFLISNGTNLLGVGNDTSVLVYSFSTTGGFTPFYYATLDPSVTIDRENPVMFHPQGTFDEAGGRLIMMVDERNPLTLQPARTIAFDVFDFDVPQLTGSNPRISDVLSYTSAEDEVKWNPVAVGPYVYTIGETSGLETWGACGLMTGRIELDSVTQLTCGGAYIHGWVTGREKIANVELFLDQGSLGPITIDPKAPTRSDVASSTPVYSWSAPVNLDQTAKGTHVLRLVATDALSNKKQVASIIVNFPGPPLNCTPRRSRAAIHN
jgi:hypothetical protein